MTVEYDFKKSYSVSLDNLAIIRGDIKRLCQKQEWHEEIEHQLQLATNEIVANIIKYPSEKPTEVLIYIYHNSKKITLEIHDNGSSFDDFYNLVESAQEDTLEYHLGDGGRGLNMLSVLFDQFDYKPKNNNSFNCHQLTIATINHKKGKPLVILIDDNPLDIDIYTAYLENDFDIIAFNHAKQALDYINNHTIDAILCDISMPDIDGFEFYNRVNISIDKSFLPFIFLSSRRDQKTEEHIKSLPISDYITKPVTKEEIIEKIQRIIKRHRYEMTMSGVRLDKKITELLAPSIPKMIGKYNIDYDWRSADAGGGDILFTFLPEDKAEKTVIFLGDVMGHGEQAKFFSVSILGFLRGYIKSLVVDNKDPDKILSSLSDLMFSDKLFKHTMVTAQVITIDSDNMIEISNAGHISPVLINQKGDISNWGYVDSLLGLTKNQNYRTQKIQLKPLEKMIFMTDGFLEVDPDNTKEPIEFLDRYHTMTKEELIPSIMNDYCKDLTDDALIVLFEGS